MIEPRKEAFILFEEAGWTRRSRRWGPSYRRCSRLRLPQPQTLANLGLSAADYLEANKPAKERETEV